MPRTTDQTRQLFDDWAQTYDQDLLEARGPLLGYARSQQALDDAFPIETGARVLDIGIGSGAVAGRLAARGAHITGIDISEKMLARCAEQHPAFDLHPGTFTQIPLPDATFDGVVSGFAFHETPPAQRAAACGEMARVLKPGGCLGLLDIMFASPPAMAEARDRIGQAWDDDEDYAIVGDLDTLLRQAGFTAVTWNQTGPFHWLVTARKA